MLRKIISVTLVLALLITTVIALAGCAGTKSKTGAEKQSAENKPESTRPSMQTPAVDSVQLQAPAAAQVSPKPDDSVLRQEEKTTKAGTQPGQTPVPVKPPEQTAVKTPEIKLPVAKPVETPTAPSRAAAGNDGAVNDKLKGRIICIDPGHQAKVNNEPEPIAPGSGETKEKMSGGTVGVATGVEEHVLNLKVSLMLKERLEKRGVKVVMTRETANVNSGNIERAKMANETNADLVIRIHADGIDNSSVRGVSVLYPGNRFISDKNLLTRSRNAAKMMLDRLTASTNAVSRGITERNDLTGFNWSSLPVILVEMGFMTNPDEDRLLNSAEYEGKLADGIVRGIEDYISSIQ